MNKEIKMKGGRYEKDFACCAVPVVFGFASVMVSTTVYATNGMNLEGYGLRYGMGGASMAYDNGTAAMMNNPATLGLMPGNRSMWRSASWAHVQPRMTQVGYPRHLPQMPSTCRHWDGCKIRSNDIRHRHFSQGGMGANIPGLISCLWINDEVRSELGSAACLFRLPMKSARI
jgi:hypothetical protein